MPELIRAPAASARWALRPGAERRGRRYGQPDPVPRRLRMKIRSAAFTMPSLPPASAPTTSAVCGVMSLPVRPRLLRTTMRSAAFTHRS